MQQSEDSAIGQIIDGYRILEVLGKGGMGIVYKAEDIALSRTVALKMIAPELASSETFLRRFHSEARALARAESPYIVGVHTLRQSGEHVFIVMEYVDGWTLADEIDNGGLDFQRTRDLLQQMLHAFARAHSEGVIHRDIKPRNIMITQAGQVKVTDFGLAKLRRDDGGSTVTQGMAGTIRYMSPEQVQGGTIDPRSDLYSLGMTMYEMLAGKLPFGGEDGTFAILKRIVEEQFPPPDYYNPSVPAQLCEVTLKAINKNPDDRFQSAEDMLEALERAYGEGKSATPARPYINVEPIAPPQGRKKANALLLAVGLVLILGAYPLYSFFFGSDDPEINTEDPIVVVDPGQDSLAIPTQVSIYTEPEGAIVFIDDERIGPSPVNRQVSEGGVKIRLALDGFTEVDTLLFVESGQHADLSVRLAEANLSPEIGGQTAQTQDPPEDPADPSNDPVEALTGTLRVSAHPAGRIVVNGRSYTANASPVLPVGEHRITFEDSNSGASKDTLVTVKANQTLDLTCYFEHRVSIQTRLEDSLLAPFASFSINGGDLNTTPTEITLGPGTYRIVASRQGYRIRNPQETLNLAPTFDPEKTVHKVFFDLQKEP